MNYLSLSREALLSEYAVQKARYDAFLGEGLSLDLSRGKPSAEQLDLSNGFLTAVGTPAETKAENGFDCRNYGELSGIPEARRFFSSYTGIPAENIIVGGNSSLNLMYDAIARCMIFGTQGSLCPWCREEKLRFLCPAPGYDRHFAITESFGFEMIPVRMTETGPDMDEVEQLVKDGSVKGIWCVPKYSNPTGITYSEETVRRLAEMQTAAPDFRIFWDNAYALHAFFTEDDTLADIFAFARAAGNEDRIFYFTSTSKITYPGGGISMVAASDANLALIRKAMTVQTIGHDKINQLRHVRFFREEGSLRAHMLAHGRIIGRKFTILYSVLNEQLADAGIATWTQPKGGYFSSLDVMEGCATRVYNLCREAGVTLTKVGATFPYGRDPEDKNLRLAPSFATDEALYKAAEVLSVAVKLASLEKLLAE